jgi:hypothetical protein
MTKKVLYGLLVGRTQNLGDDIQTLAAAQFLPRVDLAIDRDHPRLSANLKERLGNGTYVKVIMNGWFTLKPLSWMPDPLLKPLFVAFHIHPPISRVFLGRESIVEYLKYNEPIGTRDFYTSKMLRELGITSFFSGCLSLVLDYKYKFNKKVIDYDYVLLSDLDKEVASVIKNILVERNILHIFFSQNLFTSSSELLLPQNIKRMVKRILGEDRYYLAGIIVYNLLDMHKAQKLTIWSRMKLAEKYLTVIAHSRLVITSRLHTALPALSFGVPVIFVSNNLRDPRFSGYLQFLYAFTLNKFINAVKNCKLDLSEPIEMPNRGLLEEIKRKLIYTVSKFI